MNTTLLNLCRPCRFALFLALCLVPVSPSATHASESGSTSTARTVVLGTSAPAGSSVLVGGVWKSFTSFLENNLNNRRRMIQFAVLGMCLALYIMIWRR